MSNGTSNGTARGSGAGLGLRLGALLLLAVALGADGAWAGTKTWTGGSATTDNVSDGDNWGGAAPVAGDDLVFTGIQRLTPVFDVAVNYKSISFYGTAHGFTATVNQNIALTGGITVTNAASISVANGVTLTATTAVTFTGQLTLTGTGTVVLTAAGAGTGGLLLNGPWLQIGDNAACGAAGSTLTLTSGKFSSTSGTARAIANSPLAIAGSVTLGDGTKNGGLTFSNATQSITGTNLITLAGGNVSFTTGTLSLASGSNTTFSSSAATLTMSGGFNTNGGADTLTFNTGAAAVTLSGAFSGTASTLTLAGTGTSITVGSLTGGTAHALDVNATGTFFFNTNTSNFTGGVTLRGGADVSSITDSAPVTAPPTTGPFGTGTVTINGISFRTTQNDSSDFGNAFNFTGGTVNITSGNTTQGAGFLINGAVTISGSPTINTNMRGTATSGITIAGQLTLNSGLTLGGDSTAARTISGGVVTGAATRTITVNNTAGTFALSGAFSGAVGTLDLNGAPVGATVGNLTGGTAHAVTVSGGTWTFNGTTGNYTGGTTIQTGADVVAKANSNPSTLNAVVTAGPFGTGAVNINNSTFRSLENISTTLANLVNFTGGTINIRSGNTTQGSSLTLNGAVGVSGSPTVNVNKVGTAGEAVTIAAALSLGSDLTVGGTGTSTNTVSGLITVATGAARTLTCNNSTWGFTLSGGIKFQENLTVAGTGTGTVTMSTALDTNGGNRTLTVNRTIATLALQLKDTVGAGNKLALAGSVNVTVGAVTAGTNCPLLEVNGSGTYTFNSNAATYNAGTTITAGTVVVANAMGTGVGPFGSTAGLLTLAGGVLKSDATARVLSYNVTIAGTPTLGASSSTNTLTFSAATGNKLLSGTSTVTLAGNTIDFSTGALTASNGSTTTINGPGALTFTGGLIAAAGSSRINFSNTAPYTFVNTLTLTGNLTIGGTQTATLGAASTLTGAGNLTKEDSNALWIAPGTIAGYSGSTTVNNGTFGGTSTIGALTVGAIGTISPGASAGGTANWSTGAADLSATGAAYNYDINGESSDRLQVTGNLDISGATLNITATLPTLSTYVIAQYTGTLTGGAFASVTGTPTGYTLVYDAGNKMIRLDADAGMVLVFVNPSWSGSTGSDPDGSGPATAFNIDSSNTLNGALALVTAGGTIRAYTGTYVGGLALDRNVTIEVPPGNTVTMTTVGITEDATPRVLTKTGTGTLIYSLAASPAHTGGTTISNGIVRWQSTTTGAFGSGGVTVQSGGQYYRHFNPGTATDSTNFTVGTGGGSIGVSLTSNASTSTLTYSGNLGGGAAGNLTVVADGSSQNAIVALSGSNAAFTGNIALSGINSGVRTTAIRFNNASSMGGNAGTGYISWTEPKLGVGLVFSATEADLNKLAPPANAVLGLDGNYSIDLSSGTLTMANAANIRLGATQNTTYTGTITPNGNVYRFSSAGGNLTLNTTNQLTDLAGPVVRSVEVYGNNTPSGIIIFAKANNYTGGTTLYPGISATTTTLESQISNSMGSVSTGVITFAGGRLALTTAGQTHVNNIAVNVSGGYITSANSGFTHVLSGDIALTGTLAVDNPGNSTSGSGITLSGTITGNGGITMPGNANWGNTAILRITGNNSFHGGVSIGHSAAQGGNEVLQIGSDTALGAADSTLTVGVANAKGISIEAYGGDRVLANALTLSASNNNNGAVGQVGNFQGSYALTFNGNVSITNVYSSVIQTTGTGVVTFAGPVSNSASGWGLVKYGSGTLKLSSASSAYTGITRVDNGTLLIGANAPSGGIGALGNSATTVEVGRIRLQDVRVATTAEIILATVGLATIDGVALADGDRVLVKNQTTTKGQNGIYIAHSSAWTRATDLDVAGEFANGTTVKPTAGGQAGTNYYISTATLTGFVVGTTDPCWASGAPPTTVSLVASAGGISIARNISVNYMDTTGTTTIGGNNTSGTATFSGTVTLGRTSDNAGSIFGRNVTVTAASGGQVDFTGNLVDPTGLVGTGGTVTVSAAGGTVRFAGTNNTCTGLTNVTGGTLLVDGTLASSASLVTVDASTTLGGSGNVLRPVLVNGTVAPGTAIGTFTVAGGATFAAGSKLLVDINGAANDLLAVTGALDLTSDSDKLEIAGGSTLNPANTPYTIVTNTGTRTGTFNTVTNLPGGWDVLYNTTNIQLVLKTPGSLSVTPSSGPVLTATPVTIGGTDFVSSATVNFGGSAATDVAVLTSTMITCTTPALAAGKVDVTVYNNATTFATLTQGYEYLNAFSVTDVQPSSGPAAGGTSVTVSGTGFATSGLVTVDFGGSAATDLVITATTIICNTSAHAGGGAVVVTVINPDLSSAAWPDPNRYTYNLGPAPADIVLDPNAGPSSGGQDVTVTGTGFVTGATVTFDLTSTVASNFVSDTALTCVTPAHAVGPVGVTVTNPYGLTSDPGDYTYFDNWEGDVAPRRIGGGAGGGDNDVSVADWVQIGRFAAKLDTPVSGIEFQKADCAGDEANPPIGDGDVSVADWVKCGRYAAKLDAKLTAQGPTGL